MAVAYLLGNGSAPLLAGALEVPFGANASAAACRPAVPPCTAAPPGAWGNSTAGWNRSEPCGGANGSAGGGPCAPAGGGGPSVVTAIAIMALYSVVCVVGLFGNFLVMYVIIRSLTNVPFTHEESHTRKPAASGWQRDETGSGGARVGSSDSVEEQCHLPGAAGPNGTGLPSNAAGRGLPSTAFPWAVRLSEPRFCRGCPWGVLPPCRRTCGFPGSRKQLLSLWAGSVWGSAVAVTSQGDAQMIPLAYSVAAAVGDVSAAKPVQLINLMGTQTYQWFKL